MKRLIAVGVSLSLILILIWVCCGNGIPRSLAGETAPVPQFYRPQPDPSQATQPETQPADVYYSQVIAYNFQSTADGVAALELWNTGNSVVKYVQAVVWQEQRKLIFEATYLPPGGRALVQEKNREIYTLDRITDIHCGNAIRLTENKNLPVSVEESGVGSLTVSNLSDQSFSCVRVFYKQYRRELGLYAGEMTYSLVVTNLMPGESRSFSPYNYTTEGCHVVAVTVEE